VFLVINPKKRTVQLMKQEIKKTGHTKSCDNRLTELEARRLREIVEKNNSIWLIAVNAYFLGKNNTTPIKN